MIGVLADDDLGGHDDYWSPERAPHYEAAFARILASPHLELFVARIGGTIVATGQVAVLDGLSDQGARRAELQALFVSAQARSRGVGARMLAYAETWARARGAATLNLVSNKKRADAHRFYRRHGYEQRREGFSKRFEPPPG